jgi:hypothetical protein
VSNALCPTLCSATLLGFVVVSGICFEPFPSFGIAEHHSFVFVDAGVSIRSAPFGKSLRGNVYPNNLHTLACHLFFGVFREDQLILVSVGEIVGVRKD